MRRHEIERPNVPEVNFRSGVEYAVAKTVKYLQSGIGTSKKRTISLSEDHCSPYIHSYETLERYVGIINNFKDTVLLDVKKINQITPEHVEIHFDNLIKKVVTEKTVKVNASALIKFFSALNRQDLIAYINEKRGNWGASANPSCRTIPFGDPNKVIDAIRGKAFKGAAFIQYETGARISDIRKVVEFILLNPSKTNIEIEKSKGGRNRTLDYSDRMATREAIHMAAQAIRSHLSETHTGWAVFHMEYTHEVHRAASKTQEIYCGTHAFRANYANKRYDELINSDKEETNNEVETKALITITEELGHSRISMAKYYISAFRSD